MSDRDPERANLFFGGLYFALLQHACYFLAVLFLSATAASYFLLVLLWLAGVLAGLAMPGIRPERDEQRMHLAAVLVYGALQYGMRSRWADAAPLWMLFSACILLFGLSVGCFFRRWMAPPRVDSRLWIENNAFIFGIALALSSFVEFGIGWVAWGVPAAFLVWQGARRVPARLQALVTGIPTAALFLAAGPGNWTPWIALAAWATGYVELPSRTPSGSGDGTSQPPGMLPLLLVLAGFGSWLLEILLVRQFSILIAACELSILAVTLCFMTGFSLGYLLSRWVRIRTLWPAALLLAGFQILVLARGRSLAGELIHDGHGAAVLAGMFLFCCFGAASLFAVFLPLFTRDGRIPFAKAYGLELLGAFGALGTLVAADRMGWPLIPFYLACLFLLVALLLPRRAGLLPRWGLGALLALLILRWPVWEREDLERYYASRGYGSPKLLHTEQNFYHQIDIVEAVRGRRFAFLNGVQYFGSERLVDFSYYLAEIPGRLFPGRARVLIAGAGSMRSVPSIEPYASSITLVEIDPAVVASSRKYFRDFNRFTPAAEGKLRVVSDDIRRFLRGSDARYDVILFDISAPYYLQTATLHTREFFELVAGHLAPGGVFSMCLSGRPVRDYLQGRELVNAVRASMPDYLALNAADIRSGFLYAGHRLPFGEAGLRDEIRARRGIRSPIIHTPRCDCLDLQGVPPYSLDNLKGLLKANLGRIEGRLSGE